MKAIRRRRRRAQDADCRGASSRGRTACRRAKAHRRREGCQGERPARARRGARQSEAPRPVGWPGARALGQVESLSQPSSLRVTTGRWSCSWIFGTSLRGRMVPTSDSASRRCGPSMNASRRSSTACIRRDCSLEISAHKPGAQGMPFDLAERFIIAAEEKLGAPLPHSYRQAMMASNGGQVAACGDVWDLHPILDSSDRKRLSRSCNDILHETGFMRGWRAWPENAVAIAGNGTGDRLVFLRENGLYQPNVYMWLHDTGELSVVAEIFSELQRRV